MRDNPYQKYKEEAVMTMTQGEMLLLLYDELMKHLTAAELMGKTQKYDEFSIHVEKSKKIIQYLKDTLDHQYPISRELYRMYDFFLVELSRIQAARKPDEIERIKLLVEDFRDAFRQAAKKVAD